VRADHLRVARQKRARCEHALEIASREPSRKRTTAPRCAFDPTLGDRAGQREVCSGGLGTVRFALFSSCSGNPCMVAELHEQLVGLGDGLKPGDRALEGELVAYDVLAREADAQLDELDERAGPAPTPRRRSA
jgi:hypothetical protein